MYYLCRDQNRHIYYMNMRSLKYFSFGVIGMVLASCVEEKNLYNPDEGTPEDTQLGLSTDFLLKTQRSVFITAVDGDGKSQAGVKFGVFMSQPYTGEGVISIDPVFVGYTDASGKLKAEVVIGNNVSKIYVAPLTAGYGQVKEADVQDFVSLEFQGVSFPHMAVYLKPFEMVLRHLPVYAVMSTYNSWNRIPNSASRYLLTDILRDRWGFKGYVYSDWGAIEMLETFHHTAANKAEAAIQALTAGLDVEASSECYPELFRLVKEGKLDKSYIDTAVRRVLTAKFECGLFEDPYGDKHAASGGMHSLRSVELSRQIAEESIVLLKNENNLLPLDMNKLTSIAVLGPNADQVQFGDYTWSRDNKDGITPLQGIKALVGEKIKINHAVGCSMMSRDTTGIGEAVEATLKSDVAVIFCGCSSASLARDYTRTNCGEGFDLSDLSLTGAQSDLIQAVYATGKPVILVLVSGKPFAISWEKEHIPAIVAQWYGGEQEGYAIADVLFGKVNPSGHLTYSFPQSAGHLPVYYNHLPSDKGFYKRPGSYEQSGRDYVFSSPEPLWAFGHGLSYTTFSFDKMECDKNIYASGDTIEVKVQVRNTGQRTGKEVVQLYVRDLVSSVVTPVKQLKAFAKLELKPGEQKEVILKVPVSELYLIDKEGIPFLEPGEFEIQVGNASDCILQKQVIGVGDISVTAVSVSSMKQNQVKTGTGKKITMRGVVRDVQATPVEGVHIYSMGNKTELAVTNKKGEYLLKQVASDDILIFSKEGYVSKEMSVEGRSVLNVRL